MDKHTDYNVHNKTRQARAVRRGSHSELPPELRKVLIKNYVMRGRDSVSTDEYLRQVAADKEKKIQRTLQALKQLQNNSEYKTAGAASLLKQLPSLFGKAFGKVNDVVRPKRFVADRSKSVTDSQLPGFRLGEIESANGYRTTQHIDLNGNRYQNPKLFTQPTATPQTPAPQTPSGISSQSPTAVFKQPSASSPKSPSQFQTEAFVPSSKLSKPHWKNDIPYPEVYSPPPGSDTSTIYNNQSYLLPSGIVKVPAGKGKFVLPDKSLPVTKAIPADVAKQHGQVYDPAVGSIKINRVHDPAQSYIRTGDGNHYMPVDVERRLNRPLTISAVGTGLVAGAFGLGYYLGKPNTDHSKPYLGSPGRAVPK
ncbi:hypothetical protein FACS189443_2990 [Planctomycetales bacterium]|nr:hypothetical protein FACS189443_2990 [Planctomycetales bacterium]